jgi:hypothetical protein
MKGVWLIGSTTPNATVPDQSKVGAGVPGMSYGPTQRAALGLGGDQLMRGSSAFGIPACPRTDHGMASPAPTPTPYCKNRLRVIGFISPPPVVPPSPKNQPTASFNP